MEQEYKQRSIARAIPTQDTLRTLYIAAILLGALICVPLFVLAESAGEMTGSALTQATAAALVRVGEGSVTGSSVGGTKGYYELEVTRSDGIVVMVYLDKNFEVLSTFEGEEGDDHDTSDADNSDEADIGTDDSNSSDDDNGGISTSGNATTSASSATQGSGSIKAQASTTVSNISEMRSELLALLNQLLALLRAQLPTTR